MKKAKTIITMTSAFILLLSYGNMSGNIDHLGGSNSDQTSTKTVQTETKSTQTVTKPTQTNTKSTQTVSKPAQTSTKSTQTVSKPAQTSTKSTQTGSKSTQTNTKSTQTKSKSTQTKSTSVPTKSKTTPSSSKSAQTKSKSTQTSPKSEPVSKSVDLEAVKIGTQSWAIANLNVSTFRNGDTIPEAKSNKEWETAGASGKPAWCYYNNNPANGPKYGKLYNWYAVNDPRGLAPDGWILSSDADWEKLANYLGGQDMAGKDMKSTSGWSDGNNGTNETGFIGLPGGYRVENGIFQNLGSIGIWWSSTESKTSSATDHYLTLSGSLGRSNSPKQRGESVRCIRN